MDEGEKGTPVKERMKNKSKEGINLRNNARKKERTLYVDKNFNAFTAHVLQACYYVRASGISFLFTPVCGSGMQLFKPLVIMS